MPIFFRRVLAALILAASQAAGAQPLLTHSEAVRLALERSSKLQAADSALAATRELAVAAGQLPDPVLKAGLENVPLSGPDRLSLTRDSMTMRRIGVMQELTRPDKRRLRTERVERDTERLQAERQQALASVQREASLAWTELRYTQAMVGVVEVMRQETRLQIDAAELAFRTGKGSAPDVFAARAAQASLQDRLRQVQRQEQAARAMLTRWSGPQAGASTATGEVPWRSRPQGATTLEADLQDHPTVVAARTMVEIAQTELRLAQASLRPDVTVEAMYGRRGPDFPDMFSVGVSIPLPIGRAERQDREVAAKLALLNEAQAKEDDVRAEQAVALRLLLIDWQAGVERLDAWQRDALTAAQNRTTSAVASYAAGRADLMAVLAARRDELDARMQALTLEMETARLWVQLNFVVPQPAAGQQRGEQP
jgi:outer membrane protein TolC